MIYLFINLEMFIFLWFLFLLPHGAPLLPGRGSKRILEKRVSRVRHRCELEQMSFGTVLAANDKGKRT